MKHYFYFVLIVFSLSACGTVADIVGPNCNINVKADSHEPNDKPEEATPLTSVLELTGTFKELDAPDYFTVTGKTGEVIMLEKKFGLGEPTLSVKNSEDEALPVNQAAPSQTVTLPKDGTYLIQVGLQSIGNQCPDDVEYDLSLLTNNNDKIAPTIVSLTPKDKSSSVHLLAPAIIIFSEAVNKETITNESVRIVAKDGSTITKTLSLSADNKTLTIAYQKLSTNPETITITLATTIADLAGNILKSTSWSYATPTWLSLSDALDVDKTHFTFEPSMVTDKDGSIVIAWYEQDPVSNQNKIYVKRWNGETWEQLGNSLNTASDSSADYPSLVIDYQNRPVLAWHETDATFKSSIHIKRWAGSSWETIGSASSSVIVDEGEFPSLAITPDNTPVVAYAKNADIFVRFWNGLSWVTWDAAGALDDIATQNASRPSLVILGDTMTNLIPFVAFEETENSSQPSSNVYVKYYDAANFAWKDIDEINDELDIDVARDANNPTLSLALGSPLVAWEEFNGTDRDIHVKVLNGGTWEDVGNDDFGIQDSSEAILLQSYPFGEASFTYPAVVWRGSDGTGQNIYLKMFNFATGLWETPTTPIKPINTAGIGSEHPIITIDKNYRPVVAFAEFDSISNSQNLHVKVLNKSVLSEME